MDRVTQAIAAKNILGEDFYGGWREDDVGLFQSHTYQADALPGKITDFMGIRTSTHFHPWAPHYDNVVIGQLPIPDDSLRAEAIEYVALFDAIEKSMALSFSMAEIGSSYAPWTCAAAVCAARKGKTNIALVAIEASSYLFSLIPKHLEENNVDMSVVTLINGAVGTERKTLYFPRVSSPGENGGQASERNVDVDYLNRQVEHEAVQAYLVDDVLPSGIVDLIHMDIQGLEFSVLASAMDTLNRRVRSVFVGTHSRKIEGLMIDLFHDAGWELVRERPVRFEYNGNRPNVVGWTTRDGGQYWRNKRLV